MSRRDLTKVDKRTWAADRDGLRNAIVLGAAVVGIIVVGLGGWSAVARIDGAVVAAGHLGVESNRKTVQHYEGGIVRDIRVAEGDTVRGGDILIHLDDTAAQAQRALLDKQMGELLARFARLTAERRGSDSVTFPVPLLQRAHEPAIADLLNGQTAVFETRQARLATERALLRERQAQLREEIAGLNRQRKAMRREVAIIEKELRTAKALLAKKLTNTRRVSQLSRDREEKRGEAAAIAADIAAKTGKSNETELEILRLGNSFQEEVAAELRTVEAEVNALAERQITARDRLARTRVTAPRDGVVMNLRVHNRGHVIAPGEKVMEIVPADDRLVVKAKIRPEDVDKVTPGAPAELLLTAFNRRTTPRLQSRVERISPDQIQDRPDAPPHFLATLRIPKDQRALLGDLDLKPGMPAEVYIRTGDRTALSFILKPLTDSLQRAFREE